MAERSLLDGVAAAITRVSGVRVVAGDFDLAFSLYQRWLPLINHENRQAGMLAAKALMKEGGVIACEAPRQPLPAMHPATRQELIDIARRLDPLVLRWGR